MDDNRGVLLSDNNSCCGECSFAGVFVYSDGVVDCEHLDIAFTRPEFRACVLFQAKEGKDG